MAGKEIGKDGERIIIRDMVGESSRGGEQSRAAEEAQKDRPKEVISKL